MRTETTTTIFNCMLIWHCTFSMLYIFCTEFFFLFPSTKMENQKWYDYYVAVRVLLRFWFGWEENATCQRIFALKMCKKTHTHKTFSLQTIKIVAMHVWMHPCIHLTKCMKNKIVVAVDMLCWCWCGWSKRIPIMNNKYSSNFTAAAPSAAPYSLSAFFAFVHLILNWCLSRTCENSRWKISHNAMR